ncbi:YbaK/EbsC family protein [Sulfitobacter sp. HNIBRBA3233]|uniref:YbaK/EbsC family protein n=1 Tax=Sulfitobacter marinivivus TaxID=3158558 RepID=UPI0032E0196F
MGKSVKRVQEAAKVLGLGIEIVTLDRNTRTAEEAAEACDCDVGQIAKSMIFEGARSGSLVLVLVSGAHRLDMSHAAEIFGEELVRADPSRVRRDTGFAIGGVAPIGHLCELPVWMDTALLDFGTVWAAGGAPNTVFEVAPQDLRNATGARSFVAH